MSKSTILVCGGAGYIGSHTVFQLVECGYNIIILDNLSKGHLCAIQDLPDVTFVQGDVRDASILDHVFTTYRPDAVMHFCASIEVGESVRDPLSFYDNNVLGGLRLLQAMQKHNVKKLVFSSTAAVFGQPKRVPILEDDLNGVQNPYGHTKLICEEMFHWCDSAWGLKYVALRYFNACGADSKGRIGEAHEPESHLIPIILQVALGQRSKISVFGDDYDTPDGSCIRDYVHVEDLAAAHMKAVEYLSDPSNPSNAFNLGSGKGYSVKEVVESCRRVTGHAIPLEVGPRRGGDPPRLVASSEKAETVLGWNRTYNDIDSIIETAWKWHVSHPKGFGHLEDEARAKLSASSSAVRTPDVSHQ